MNDKEEKEVKKAVYKNIALSQKLFTIWETETINQKKVKHLEKTDCDNAPMKETKMPVNIKKSRNYEIKNFWQRREMKMGFNPHSPNANPYNLMETISIKDDEVLEITHKEYEKIRDKEKTNKHLTDNEKQVLNLIDSRKGGWERFCVWYEKNPEYSYSYHINEYQPNELKIESYYYPKSVASSQLEILKEEDWKKLLDWLSNKLSEDKLTFEGEKIEKSFREEYNNWVR